MQKAFRPNDAELWGREQFLTAVRKALHNRTSFATAKIGPSELQRLNYGLLAGRLPADAKLLRVLQPHMAYQTLRQSALFPTTHSFYMQLFQLEQQNIQQMDCLGVFPDLWERTRTTLKSMAYESAVIDYQQQEPDRSLPSDASNCYLPYLRGKKLLIISSFARLAAERATRERFEAVWNKTGKEWFYPEQVDYLEFPFGYAETTHRQYASSLELLDEITAEMSRRDFDCALIAAGGMGIHIAAHAKRLGKVGISLGGHLQVLFGIQGKRWKERPDWQERYVNAHWIDMPQAYRPPEASISGDGGAYW